MKNNILIYIIFLLSIQTHFVQPVYANDINSKELTELINEYETFVINKTEKICWNDVKISFTMNYEGSTIPPADMIFLSNSIMVLKSYFFSENLQIKENRLFRYSINNDMLKLYFIDSRINARRSLDVALYYFYRNREIFHVDEKEKSVTYDFSKKKYYLVVFIFSLINGK
jgi:hypothetical protein